MAEHIKPSTNESHAFDLLVVTFDDEAADQTAVHDRSEDIVRIVTTGSVLLPWCYLLPARAFRWSLFFIALHAASYQPSTTAVKGDDDIASTMSSHSL